MTNQPKKHRKVKTKPIKVVIHYPEDRDKFRIDYTNLFMETYKRMIQKK